jgi:hypothetical protein
MLTNTQACAGPPVGPLARGIKLKLQKWIEVS